MMGNYGFLARVFNVFKEEEISVDVVGAQLHLPCHICIICITCCPNSTITLQLLIHLFNFCVV